MKVLYALGIIALTLTGGGVHALEPPCSTIAEIVSTAAELKADGKSRDGATLLMHQVSNMLGSTDDARAELRLLSTLAVDEIYSGKDIADARQSIAAKYGKVCP